MRPLPTYAMLATVLAASAAQASDGSAVFRDNCIACHQAEARGAPGLAPALVGPHWSSLKRPQDNYILQVLSAGLVGKISVNGEPYNGGMPSFKHLPAEDVAAVANYVLALNQLSLAATPLGANDVLAARDKNWKQAQVRALRQSLVKE